MKKTRSFIHVSCLTFHVYFAASRRLVIKKRVVKKVGVYCASSTNIDLAYYQAAETLGKILAQHRITILYGGGSVGLMGRLADSAMAQGGKVIGILPKFMNGLEWGHQGISELKIVKTLHERKNYILRNSDAVIALPGGCGTFEELLEAITWKRLGLYLNPVVIVNTCHFYDPLVELLENAITEQFMDARHRLMWTVVQESDEVVDAITTSPSWSVEARNFASIGR